MALFRQCCWEKGEDDVLTGQIPGKANTIPGDEIKMITTMMKVTTVTKINQMRHQDCTEALKASTST